MMFIKQPHYQTKGKFYTSEPIYNYICIAIKLDIIYADFWSFPFHENQTVVGITWE